MGRVSAYLVLLFVVFGIAPAARSQDVEEPPISAEAEPEPVVAAEPEPVVAAEPEPEPQAEPLRPVPPLGDAWDHRLPNGLHIVGRPDPRQEVAAVCVSYAAGPTRDPRGLSGLALLTQRLHHSGITPRFHDGVATHFLESGTQLRWNSATFCISVPDEELEQALHAESERMAFLLRSLSEEHVRSEVELLLQREQRTSVIGASVEQALHGYQESYASDEELNDIELAHVQWFHQTYYTPANAVLAIISRRSQSEITELTERYFAHIRGEPRPAPVIRERSPVEPTRIDITGRLPRSVTLHWSTPVLLAEGDEALDLVAGHLQLRLRRELGSAALRILAHEYSGQERSTFTLSVEAANNVDLEALQRRLERTVHSLGDSFLTDEELQAARNSFIRREPNRLTRAANLAMRSQYAGELMPVEATQTHLDSIEAWEVRVAARLLRGPFVAVIYQYAPQRDSILVRRMP